MWLALRGLRLAWNDVCRFLHLSLPGPLLRLVHRLTSGRLNLYPDACR